MKTKREWRLDPDAETILRDITGLPYTMETISLKQVDWSESANNCARLTDPLNAEKIEDYASAMRRGDVFPMIVVERHKKNGRYIILGGNQRSAALKSIDSEADVDCYVVDPLTGDERELVIRSLNSRHGWGSSKEERLEHAVFMVRKYGMHVDTVARAMVVSTSAIRDRINAETERVRLAGAGIDASKMGQTAIAAITRIADEKLRNAVAIASIEKKSTALEITDLSNAVSKASSFAKAAAAIADFKKAADAVDAIKKGKLNGKMKKPRRDRFLTMLTSLSDFLERGNDGSAFSTLNELSCSVEHDLDNVRVLTAKISSRLNCICEAQK